MEKFTICLLSHINFGMGWGGMDEYGSPVFLQQRGVNACGRMTTVADAARRCPVISLL